jgi:RHS repeat-associated protein
VALAGALTLVASTLVVIPVAVAAPGGEERRASSLPALRSEAAPKVAPVASDAVFSGAPPIDGDVARRNEELAADRDAARGDEKFDPAEAELVASDAVSDTYRNADGTQTRVVHESPVNFQDPVSGEWHRFDVGLERAADGSARVKASSFDVEFAARADASELVRVGAPGWSVGLRLEGAAPSDVKIEPQQLGPGARGDGDRRVAAREGMEVPESEAPKESAKPLWTDAEPPAELNVASYGEVAPGVELRYYSSPESVKEEIVLTRAPTGPLVLRFPLDVAGVTPRVDEDGSIGFYDGAGVRVAGIPAAWMVDATALEPGGPGLPTRVAMTIEVAGTGPVLVLVPDPVWLADPARVFPVSIDPTIQWGTATAQADIEVEDCTGGAYDGAAQHIGYGLHTNRSGLLYPGCQWRSLAWYDLGAANGTFIQSASWSPFWYQTGNYGYGVWNYVNANAASWCTCYLNWNLQPPVYSDLQLVVYPPTNARAAYDITSFAKLWASGSNWGLTTHTNDGASFVDWLATETPGTTYDSWVDVTYDHPPAASMLSTPADATVFNTTTPTGFAGSTATDPDGQTVKYWLRVSTNPGGDTGQVYNSGWVATPDSSATGFFGANGAIPPGTLQDGVTYYWKIYTGDFANPSDALPITQTASLSRSFKVDLRLGAQGTNPTDSIGPATVNLSNGNLSVTTGSPSFPTVGGPIGLTFSYNSQQPTTKGLRGSYYDEGATPNFVVDGGQEPFLVRDDPRIDFNWGSTSPVPNGPADNVLVRWRGYVTVPSSGDWVFGARSDDGVRIWINQGSPQLPPSFNGQLNQWSDQPQPANPQWGSAVNLTGGVAVPIQVDYYERGVLSALTLYAKKSDGSEEQIVDASWLSTDPQVLPVGWRASADLDGALGYTGANISTNQVVITDASGQPHTYTSTGAGFTPPTGEYSTLVRNSDATLTLHDDSGTDYRFSKEGQLLDATAAGVDDRTPAAPKYNYTGSPPRLESIEDRVSGKKLLLKYSGDGACSGSPPSGFDATAPSGMLCRLDYADWGFGVTNLWYVNGQLGRLEDPGGEVTDFAYDNGRLTTIRDPLAADAVAAAVRANDDTTRTIIHYDDSGRVDSVKLAEPLASAARPEHQYRYVSGSETQVDVVGVTPAAGYARRVLFDGAGRVTDDYDATAKHATATWDPRDLPLSATDPAGIVTTTGYDPQGRATSTSAAGGGTTATSTATYDAGMPGLLATWWDNKNLTGVPKAHTLGIGGSGDSIDKNWGSGAPGPAGIGADNFGLRLTGEINLPTTGNYKFRVTSDDGVRLYVDDKLVIDHWVDGAGTWPDSPDVANIAANGTTWHRIRIDLYENAGGAQLTLQWIPPGGGVATVPGTNLIPRLDLVTATQDPDAKTTATTYADPALGLATGITVDPGGLALTTSTGYETPGSGFLRRTARTLPAGNSWTYAYYGNTEARTNPCPAGGSANQAGFLKTRTGPDPDGAGAQIARVEETVYDTAGRPVASRINDESWACVTYDSRGRVDTRTIPAFGGEPSRTVTNDYSVGGDPLTTKVSDAAGDITATVDLLGRVVSYTDVWNTTTTTSYDQAGRATASSGPLGAQAITYDDAGRVEQITLDGDVLADPAYDTAGRFDSVAYPSGAGNAGNGTSLAPVSRDALGRVNGLTWRDPTTATITSDAVTRSLAGRVTDQAIDGIDADPSNPNFVYDTAGRLTTAAVPAHALTYGFDPTGGCGGLATAGRNSNRTSMTGNGGTPTTYCYDNADKLTATTTPDMGTITYDAHGNTTSLGSETLTYDGADRHAGSHAPGVTVDYTRDATDRIVERTTTSAIAYRDEAHATGSASSVTINRPTGAVDGDVLVAHVVVRANPTITPPSGWTHVDTATVTGGALAVKIRAAVYVHTATGGDPTAWTWTFSSTNQVAASISAYSGVDPADPVDVHATATETSVTTSHDAASVTTTETDARLITAYGIAGPTATTPAASMTERVDIQGGGALLGASAELSDQGLTTTGSTGARTATSASSYKSANITVALRPSNGATTQRYSYTGGGDTPDVTLDASNNVLEKNYGLPGGASLTKRAGGDVWSYPNIHGDIVATADNSGAKQGSTYTYDPYGNPLGGVPDNQEGAYDNGWLGQHRRGFDHEDGLLPVVEMGARQYLPLIGRFLESDPVEAGGCSDYEYVCGDPLGARDLDGTRIRRSIGNPFCGLFGIGCKDKQKQKEKKPKKGMRIYRVYGPPGTKQFGRSWTPVDPRGIDNYRARAGLPDTNTGTRVVVLVINDPKAIDRVLKALPMTTTRNGGAEWPGGLTEFVIENAEEKLLNGQLGLVGDYALDPPA